MLLLRYRTLRQSICGVDMCMSLNVHTSDWIYPSDICLHRRSYKCCALFAGEETTAAQYAKPGIANT